jgi:protein O-mannosyl-transferase
MALALLAVLAFLPALSARFIWDDDELILENPYLRSLSGLWTLWSAPLASGPHYFPLSYSSFWLDWHLWGTNPFGYHLVNLLLHAVNAVLLYGLLRKIGVRGAWLAAALFAIHPVQSASVAWVVERKNLLCAFFYFLALYAWLGFERTPRAHRYLCALILFLLAMLSKTIAVSFPVTLLILAWWRQGRIGKALVIRVTPFFIAGGALALLSTVAHQKSLMDYGLTTLDKAVLVGRALCFYAGKLLWPVNLMAVYPRWSINSSQPWQYLFSLSIAVVFVGLWASRRRVGRGPLAAIAFYAVTLAPILGFIQYSVMSYSYVHDHHQYLACIGPFALLAAGLYHVLERLTATATKRRAETVVVVVTAAILLPLGALTWRETRYYRDMGTFFQHNLDLNPEAWPAALNLGVAHLNAGDLKQAEALFRKTLTLAPSNVRAMWNLASALRQQRRHEEALPLLDETLKLSPDLVRALSEKGRTLGELGRCDEARPILERALSLEPGNLDVMNNLAICFLAAGDPDRAEPLLEKVLATQPSNAAAHANLGILLSRKGKMKEAVAHLKEALRLDPKNGPARRRLDQLGERSPSE